MLNFRNSPQRRRICLIGSTRLLGERVVCGQLQVQGLLGLCKILLVHSVRKPRVPDEAGLPMLKPGRGREKLVVLVIGEIKKNNHKAIILAFVVCFRRQEGEERWRALMLMQIVPRWQPLG